MKHFILTIGLLNCLILFSQELNYESHSLFSGTKSIRVVDIEVDASKNVYALGIYEETGDLDFSLPTAVDVNDDVVNSFVAKLNDQGEMLWSYQILSNTASSVSTIKLNDDGEVYVIGLLRGETSFIGAAGVDTLLSPTTSRSGFILKLMESGTMAWVRQLDGSKTVYSTFTNLAIDLDGNPIIQAEISGPGDIDLAPEEDRYVGYLDIISTSNLTLSLDEEGKYNWHNIVDPSGWLYTGGLVVDKEGNVFVSGSIYGDVIQGETISAVGSNDAFIQKLNSNGELIWFKTVGGEDSETNHSLNLDEEGNVYLSGEYRGIGDFDPGNGEFILEHKHNSDTYILKLTNNGEFVWAKSLLGDGFAHPNNIVLDEDGDLYMIGYMWLDMDYDPDECTKTVQAVGGSDLFIQKVNKDGKLMWVKTFKGASSDSGSAIEISDENEIYLSGYFQGQINLSLSGDDTKTIISKGHWDSFVVKMSVNPEQEKEHCPSVTGLNSDDYKSEIMTFPNPVINTLQIEGLTQTDKVEIYNLQGIKVLDVNANKVLDLSMLASGVYTLKVVGEHTTFSQRVIKK